MEKKQLLECINKKRKEGLSNRKIFDTLKPEAAKLWSDEELVGFVYQTPSSADMEKFKPRNNTLLMLIAAAYLFRVAFLVLQSLVLNQQAPEG